MKKGLSLFLSLIVLITSVVSVNIFVFAADEVKSISYKPSKSYEIIEHTQGYSDYIDGKEVWIYTVYSSSLNLGDVLSVTYSSGKTTEYVNDEIYFDDAGNQVPKGSPDFSYSMYTFVSDNGELLNEDISIDSNQSEEPWGIGNHYFTISYQGVSTQLPVAIIECPVESISLTLKDAYLTQGYDSRVHLSNDNCFDYYDVDTGVFKYGDCLTVSYKDKTEKDFIYTEANADDTDDYFDSFVAKDGEKIYPSSAYDFDIEEFENGKLSTALSFYFNFDQSTNPMIPGNEYPLTFTYLGAYCNANVKIKKSDVASIKFKEGTVVNLKKGENSYIQEDSAGNSYDHYFITNFEKGFVDCPITITKTDGTLISYGGFGMEKCYYAGEYDFSVNLDSQQYANHWNVGETHVVRFWYTADVYTDLTVKIVDENYVSQTTTAPVAPDTTLPTAAPVQPTTQANITAPTTPPQQTTTTKPASIKVSGKVYKLDKNGDYVSSKVKKPSISKATKAKKSFKVTWKKISAVSGYQAQYSTSKKFTKKTTKTATVKGNKSKTPTATIRKLKSKKTYYVRVRTYKTVKVNGKTTKVYSSWSKVKSVKTK